MTVKVASSEAPVKSSILSEKQPAGASAGPYSSILPDHTKVPHRYLQNGPEIINIKAVTAYLKKYALMII
ncbi:hypothetical protein LCB89_000244 [Salmonella enterica]|nr:hypothetical protein [Salmonella enterica]